MSGDAVRVVVSGVDIITGKLLLIAQSVGGSLSETAAQQPFVFLAERQAPLAAQHGKEVGDFGTHRKVRPDFQPEPPPAGCRVEPAPASGGEPIGVAWSRAAATSTVPSWGCILGINAMRHTHF